MYLIPGLFCDITITRFFVSRPFSPSMYFFGRTHVLIFHKFSMLVTFVTEKKLVNFENTNLKKVLTLRSPQSKLTMQTIEMTAEKNSC